MNVEALHLTYNTGTAISHISASICAGMIGEGCSVRLTVPGSDPGARRAFIRDAMHPLVRKAAYRLGAGGKRIADLTSRAYFRSLRGEDVAYLWPGTPLEIYRRVKDAGATLVMERINTHRRTARAILDAEYARLGLPAAHGIDEEATRCEEQKLALADCVFSPSPAVTRSLIDAGVPAERVLSSSYGWDPARVRRFDAASHAPAVGAPPVFLFVGRVCVRKGAPVLLRAWERAGVRGRLVLTGSMDEDVRTLCAGVLAREDVEHVPYTRDIASVYARADAFVFPTHEEGSPLVIYEALAAGLPVISTHMGCGEIVRDGVEGRLLPDASEDAVADALRAAARDIDQLRAMRPAAAERADEFTWDRVGARRRETLEGALRARVG